MSMNPHVGDYNLGAQGGRIVSFSFKIEKSQLMTPKQTDYVLVSQDGQHCGGSAKFNGVTSDTGMGYVEPQMASSNVICETAHDYQYQQGGSAAAATSWGNYSRLDHVNL